MNETWTGRAQERALWRRWSTMQVSATDEGLTDGRSGPAEPDALTLAAFAEDRLSADARAAVEAFLAVNPEIAADVAAARRAVEPARCAGDAALEATIARAAALVSVRPDTSPAANILPFRPTRPPGSRWRGVARWGALAASLALVSWLGFALGSDAYGDLVALQGQSGTRLADELLDPPAGFFGLVDTSGT